MPELTICMPSHRNFEDSRAAIESALVFCEKRDALLIVSDNSGDEAKKNFWEGRSPRLKRIQSDAENATDNMMLAVRAAETPFIMLMGDDDMLGVEEGVASLNLSDLPFDYVGVFPVSEVFLSPTEIVSVSVRVLEQDNASARMMAYMEQGLSNKAPFYSIFRRYVWLSVMDLFHRFHPNRAGFCAWALSFALITSGKMASDPSIRYHYNKSAWRTNELILSRRKEIFTEVGLPEKAMHYEHLFWFLDVFVLINSAGSTLSIDERQHLGKLVVNVLLGKFIVEVANSPELFDDGIGTLAEMALEETDSFAQFQLGLLMIERVQPGLKDKYVTFIQAAISGA
ncbi:hypothetical protein H4S14_002501 [Agrobacterium vitis]|nr:hypothetical protein [Agrobacterium vitis]MBE1438745.1 hypothetical protein [Agrobacterium vitis]